LSIDIRPFNETGSEISSSPKSESDARASAFMESLRTRVNHEDEVRKQKWDKVAAKYVIKRKPAAAPPEWLVQNKPAKNATKTVKAVRTHPLASTRKSKGS
jgi:hypothetical protein